MAVITSTDLTTYIKSMADSARVAQQALTTGTMPMVLTEFHFKANISGQVSTSYSSGTSLQIARFSIREQVMTQYRAEWGLSVECKIMATV